MKTLFPSNPYPNLTAPRVPFPNVVLPNSIPYHSSRPATVPNIEPDHEPHVIDPSPDTIAKLCRPYITQLQTK